MGPANPWSPNWRPDPTGRRLAAIRTARRGAALAAVLLGAVTIVAGLVAPEAAGRPPTVPFAIAAMAIPALALLGAGLAPAAIGSRIDALAAGIALAIGAPVAAAFSIAIAVLIVTAMSEYTQQSGVALGAVIRIGVVAAIRVAPLLAAAVVLWVIAVRRMDRSPAV
jgi:uncharacterized membrane protein (DUF373 family)